MGSVTYAGITHNGEIQMEDLIQEQVTMGVAIRMACLEILINNRDRYAS